MDTLGQHMFILIPENVKHVGNALTLVLIK